MTTRTLRFCFSAGLALASLACGGSSPSDVQVGGLIVDPEKFLYARLGLLARATGGSMTGPCWDAQCTGSQALQYVKVNASVAALEDPMVRTTETATDGTWSLMAPVGQFYHFVTTPLDPATYVPTIDGAGTLCAASGVAGAVIHGCGNYGMMQMVSSYLADGGVASVVVMNDAGIPEFLPVMEPDHIHITATGGELRYWIFNPHDPAGPNDPAWGWQPLAMSPSDIPSGMIWIGMVSIIHPTGDTVHVEITDTGAGAGRPYTYDALDLKVAASHYTFAEAVPSHH